MQGRRGARGGRLLICLLASLMVLAVVGVHLYFFPNGVDQGLLISQVGTKPAPFKPSTGNKGGNSRQATAETKAKQEASKRGMNEKARYFRNLQETGDLEALTSYFSSSRHPPAIPLGMGRKCQGKPIEARCRVAICTALFYEEPYVEEWLRFYSLIGVEHFYLMILAPGAPGPKESESRTNSVLKPWINRGQVTTMAFKTVYHVPSLMEQVGAIGKCFKIFGKRTDWMFTFDVDEFYYSRHFPSLHSLIASAEANRSDAINIPWYMFGADGHEKRPEGISTFRAYTRRAKDMVWEGDNSTYYERRNGKMAFRGACYQGFPNTHRVNLAPSCGEVSYTPILNASEYHLKHYQVKSYQDWLWKRKGNGFTGFRSEEVRVPVAAPQKNKSANFEIRRFWNHLARKWRQEWVKANHLFNDTEDTDMLIYEPVMEKLAGVNPDITKIQALES